MREVVTGSVEITTEALDRFERKVWLARCQQDREVNARYMEQRTILMDDGGFLFLCHHLDGGEVVLSHVLPGEWCPRYAA
jgi:hypothetical protein